MKFSLRKYFSKFSKKPAINSKASSIRDRVSRKLDNIASSVSILEAFRSAEVRKKFMITVALLIVFRILAAVPLPGVDVRLFSEAFGNSPLSSFFSILTGGRLDNPSVVAIGLGAYINASIIVQLMQTVIPKLEELSKEGERGRKVLSQITRFLAVPLTLVQAFVIFTYLKNVINNSSQLAGLIDNITTLEIVTMIAALTAGSMVLMWIGELITEYGIGNGISMIIMVGILVVLPGFISTDFAFLSSDLQLLANGNFNVLINSNFQLIYAVILGIVLLVMGIVYITESVRNIPIQYARRVRGSGPAQGSKLPLKINQAGVIPVIFASALLTFPQIIAQLLLGADADSFLYKVGSKINGSFLGATTTNQGSDQLYYAITYFVLIVVFTFFYTFLTYKPSETAENLQKAGGFIPGLRPGKATEKFIGKVLVRLTVLGSLFLAVIALIPNLVRSSDAGSQLTLLSGIGGTSILIVVGVVLDTMRQIKAITVTKSYDQYK